MRKYCTIFCSANNIIYIKLLICVKLENTTFGFWTLLYLHVVYYMHHQLSFSVAFINVFLFWSVYPNRWHLRTITAHFAVNKHCAHSCNGLIISPSTTVPHTSLGAVTYFTIHIPTTHSASYFYKSTALASQCITLMRFCVDLWGFGVFESIFSFYSFCIGLDFFFVSSSFSLDNIFKR